jgi:hypothetical protein
MEVSSLMPGKGGWLSSFSPDVTKFLRVSSIKNSGLCGPQF